MDKSTGSCRVPLYKMRLPELEYAIVADARRRLAAKKYLVRNAGFLLAVLNLYPTHYLRELCRRVRDRQDPYLDNVAEYGTIWYLVLPNDWSYRGSTRKPFLKRRDAEELGACMPGSSIHKMQGYLL